MSAHIQKLNTQPVLTALLIELMRNQHRHMSTLDLLRSGILSPASGIARLKQKGMIIETIYQTIADGSGRLHKRVACYKLLGGAAI